MLEATDLNKVLRSPGNSRAACAGLLKEPDKLLCVQATGLAENEDIGGFDNSLLTLTSNNGVANCYPSSEKVTI